MSNWRVRRARRALDARRWAAGVAGVGLVAGLLVSGGPQAAATAARPGPRPAMPRLVPARGVRVLGTGKARMHNQAASVARPSGTTWPRATSGVVSLASAVPLKAGAPLPVSSVLEGRAPGGGLAGTAGVPVVAGRAGLAPGPSGVAVSVLGHRAAVAARVSGVLFTARAAGVTGGLVRLGVNYAGFAQISGGNYGLGLNLEVLPGCALTTPQVAACRKGRPLASVNDAKTRTVSAIASVPGAGGGLLVVAAAPGYTDGGGAAGTYNATTLRASGTWSAGGSAGSFTYGYPMSVPPAPGSLVPQVGLNYDSGSVDGQTASTQAQASWVGDGWTSPQAFVEQSFTPCQDKPEGSAAPQSTPDQCYDGSILTLSLNGQSTPLVCPVPFSYTTTSTCTAASDNGEVITHHVSSNNGQGTKFTDWWSVTERSGTTYSFGLNHLPGWASGDATTNSTDSAPVFSAHSGDPCYNSTWADSVCTMAYRWNLDYVKDLHGNAMAYYYDQDTNAYAENGKTTSAVSYIRDSHLDHIDYGLTDGNAYSGHAPDQVSFATGDRCFTGTCDPLNSANAKNWLDVPYTADYCAAGASCQTTTPSFWSTVRLVSVTASQWNGSKYVAVDSWALAQHFPATGDGTSPALWLDSVTRTGSDTTAGGGSVTLPKLSFAGSQLGNRTNPGNNPALDRYRITAVTTETGAVISVTYGLPVPCTPGGPYPAPSDNHTNCFPVYWGAFTPGNLGEDWFNKYAVTQVTVSDPAGGSPGTFTSYTYAKPAWHYDDNEVVKTAYRTWGQWRGYGDVLTYNGTGTDPNTESETTYYQGMSDDNNSTEVDLLDSQKASHEDVNQLAGDVLESTAYTYPGGPVDHSEIYSYWVSGAVATRTRTAQGLTPLTANLTGQVEDWARQAITDTSITKWRDTESDTSYDTNLTSPTAGLPLFTFAHGDLNDSTQQRCTAVSYAPANLGENLTGLPAETETDALPCGGSNPAGSSAPGSGQVNALTAPSGRAQSNVVSDTRVFYDNPSLATTWPQPANPAWPQAVPTLGDVSVVRQATGYSGGSFSYQTKSAAVYDSYGRLVKSYDSNGGFNGTTYNPTVTSFTMANGSTTSETVTNPLGQATTTVLDPLRGLPVTVTDPNGIPSYMHYDGLGRLTAVWEHGRAVTSAANLMFSYQMTGSGPVVVTTQQLDDAGRYITSASLYDSLLRLRQTQVPTPQGGMVVTDHFYDSRGFEWKTNNSWWDAGANPGSTIVTVPDSQVPNQTYTQFDGLGRPVIVTSYDDSAVKSVAYTLFTGDKVTTIPPSGATPTTVTTDALARKTELDSYTTAPAVTTGTNPGGFPTVTLAGGAFQATTYSYETRGWLSATTDVSTGEQWTHTYNSLGQEITSTDPNAGTTSTSYDADGNVLSATDALGHTISYSYDPLGRRTGEYDGPSPTSPQIASWTYDNSNNAVPGMTDPIGQLTTETSTSGGNTYAFQQTGFNAFGESLGQKVTIPTAEGNLAGTFTLSHTYTATTGLPYRDSYPASPGGAALPAETVTHGYIAGFDLPSSLSSNLAAYAQSTTYTAFLQIGQEEIGSSTSNAYITNTYDPHTGALTDSQVANTAVSPTPYDDTSYGYDPSGNITSEQDVRNGTTTELQCFGYDLLQRLTSAWTTDGSHTCAAGPSTGTGGTVGDGIAGGAYWTSWIYNALGDQQSQDQHSVTGGTDTVTTDSYNGNGKNQPDTLTGSTTTGPGAGTASYSYDAAGNTLTRVVPTGNQSLTWYDNGKLKSDSTPAGTTSYVYDAEGNLLLQKDPGQTTLYLFGEQLILNTGTGAVTGTRFLTLPGGGIAVRTGAGSAYGFEITDAHGTSLLALDNTAANPVWRQETPFGAPRGTPTGTWLDTNGFLGKPTSTNTGLTIIGARDYDSTTGRFISIDPVLQTGSPQQLNGYTYGADNPVTRADPTGMMLCDGDICGSVQFLEHVSAVQQHQEIVVYQHLASYVEGQNFDRCEYRGGCIQAVIQAYKKPAYVVAQVEQFIATQQAAAQQAAKAAVVLARQRAQQHSTPWWETGLLAAGAVALTVVNVVQVGADPATDALEVADVGALVVDVSATAAEEGATAAADDAAISTEEEAVNAEQESMDASCGGASFTAATKVLLASGAVMAIAGLKPGDKVMATSARTGRTHAKLVVAVLVHHDTNLYNLSVGSGHRRALIHTTRNHPFWDVSTGHWTKAAALQDGDRLKTPHGAAVTVLHGLTPRRHQGWMWDLTVSGDHDFYIVTAAATILVHNIVCRSLPSTSTAKNIALGTRTDIQEVRDWEDPEYEVLTLPKMGTPGGWTPEMNDEWVSGAIQKGQSAYLSSPLTDENIFSDEFPSNNGTTVFGREVFQLLDGGYSISDDEQWMLPPGR